jgi:4-amino-4-deoxy-L-arabinose transferase-like glycosyltransferase
MKSINLSRHTLWTVMALVALTLFRLWYVNRLELLGDEAYYWLWSRHPDLCYLDKGPVIAWFITLGTALFGQTVLGVRFFAVLLSTGTGVALFLLARKLFSDRVGFIAVTLAALTPLYAVGSILMTIDTIYIFFWSVAALSFWWAKDQTRLWPWILTGVWLGLGILAKYTAAFELLSFGCFCAWHAPSRRHLRGGGFLLMLLTVALFLVPVAVWNAAHGWPTSRFLTHRGDLDQRLGLHPLNVLTFLGGQAGVISPLLLVAVLAAAFRPGASAPNADKGPETAYLLSLFWPLFGFYLLLSFQQTSQANWPAAAYVGGLLLVAARWDHAFTPGQQRARHLALATVAVAAMETAMLHDTRWLHLPHRADPLDRARGWRDLAEKVVALQQSTGAQFVIANKYMTASLLSFYLPHQPAVYMPVSSPPYNQLVLWPGYRQEHPCGDALLISDVDRASPSLAQDFRTVEPLGAVDTQEGSRKVNRFYVFVCRRGHVNGHPMGKG